MAQLQHGAKTLQRCLKEASLARCTLPSTSPTHHLLYTDPPSHTTLDLFLVKHIKSVVHFTQSNSPFIAGHDFIHLTLNVATPKPPPKTVICRTLKSINTEQLHHLISARLPPLTLNLQSDADINLLEHSITTSILSSFDHLAPNRSITILPKHKPWITPHIKNLMKKRDKAYKIASQSRSAD